MVLSFLAMGFSQETFIDFKKLNISTLKPNNVPFQNIIFSSNEDWNQFWAKYNLGNEPKIDFSKYYVAGVFLGERPNPGFGAEIKGIKKINGYIQINYVEYLPNPLYDYAQVIVYPYELVYFHKTHGKIIFSGSKEIRK